MLILMVIIFVAASFALMKFSDICETDAGEAVTSIIGIFLSVIALGCIIIWFVCLLRIFTAYTIDEQIEMYTTENKNIELRIDDTVNNYMQYEQSTYEKMKVDDPVAVVAAYPELNSSAIVQEQIQIYTDNNQKIKELKEAQITVSEARFLVYFGR